MVAPAIIDYIRIAQGMSSFLGNIGCLKLCISLGADFDF